MYHDEKWFPCWFVRLTAAVLTLAVPWGAWVTMQLITIGVRIEAIVEMRRQVDAVSARLSDHLADPEIHHAATRDMRRRIERIEQRVP